MIVVSTIGFSRYARSSGVVRNNFEHCIVGKIQDGRYMAKVKH